MFQRTIDKSRASALITVVPPQFIRHAPHVPHKPNLKDAVTGVPGVPYCCCSEIRSEGYSSGCRDSSHQPEPLCTGHAPITLPHLCVLFIIAYFSPDVKTICKRNHENLCRRSLFQERHFRSFADRRLSGRNSVSARTRSVTRLSAANPSRNSNVLPVGTAMWRISTQSQ